MSCNSQGTDDTCQDLDILFPKHRSYTVLVRCPMCTILFLGYLLHPVTVSLFLVIWWWGGGTKPPCSCIQLPCTKRIQKNHPSSKWVIRPATQTWTKKQKQNPASKSQDFLNTKSAVKHCLDQTLTSLVADFLLYSKFLREVSFDVYHHKYLVVLKVGVLLGQREVV